MTNQKNKKHHQNAAPAFPAQDRRFQMTNAPKPLTASAIKYLLVLLELCKNETGARCMDIAGQLHVTKPSVHSMIGNLCSAGLAEKKKYGNVFLTPAACVMPRAVFIRCRWLDKARLPCRRCTPLRPVPARPGRGSPS